MPRWSEASEEMAERAQEERRDHQHDRENYFDGSEYDDPEEEHRR